MAASPEQKKSYQVIKAFKGLNTKANRTAIDEQEFAWLENIMPVGFGNAKVVPVEETVSITGNAVTWGANVTFIGNANINLKNYIVVFEDDGRSEYFNVTDDSKGNVAVAGTFSGANNRIAQWKDERILITDPDYGLFTWDGNNTVFVGSVGQIALTNLGTGYTSAPAVTISAPNDANGVQATASAVLSNGTVSTILLTEPGTGYTTGPTVTISGGGGANAAAVAGITTFKKGTVYCVVESGGTDYTNTANLSITFSGGGGNSAAATAIVRGNSITSVIMTNPGQGYTSNPTVTVSGGGGANATIKGIAVTNQVSDVSTFSGRVWVSQGRTASYSSSLNYNDFVTVSAGSEVLTDGTLHGNIRSTLSANNFLYIFGDDSINVFSDVRVDTDGTTIFTNTNVSASVGSDLDNAIFPYFRSVLLMNRYGIYALVGSTTSKISDGLDGIFPLIDFSYPVYGGQVLLNNILCAAFTFYYNDPDAGARPLQAVFFEKKWFLTSQGTFRHMTSVPVGGLVKLYASDQTNLMKLFANSTSAIESTMKTALWPLGDPIRSKQALKFAIEATTSLPVTLNVTVDSETSSSGVYTLYNVVEWVNDSNVVIPWINASSETIDWTGGTDYQLYKSDAEQWGKYLGLTITSNSAGFVYNTLELEHELRARF